MGVLEARRNHYPPTSNGLNLYSIEKFLNA